MKRDATITGTSSGWPLNWWEYQDAPTPCWRILIPPPSQAKDSLSPRRRSGERVRERGRQTTTCAISTASSLPGGTEGTVLRLSKPHSSAVLKSPEHGMGYQFVEVVANVGYWEGDVFVVDGLAP